MSSGSMQIDIFKEISKISLNLSLKEVEGRVEFKGNVSKIIYQLKGGLKSSMGYIGAKNLKNKLPNMQNLLKLQKLDFMKAWCIV